ncbi:delta-type opioid receptor-like [Betta splendens]|uniref:Delta-type opioid receptor-like n=1 Tax=Betta splendens TaxID=158456 RepID=A0A6P7M2N2_BETSP|nr:delta-type opioid receptor-like [Betta splendens]
MLPNLTAERSAPGETASAGLGAGTAAACAILGLCFLLGAPGNLLVIWTILRHVRKRSHTVVLILHLAAADLLVVAPLPLWIYSLARSWVFGEAFCKALVYVISVCMFSSIFFITLMSVERFLAICYPLEMQRWKGTRAMNAGPVLLWLLALPLGVPSATAQTLSSTDGVEQCFSKKFSSVAPAVALLCLETVGGFIVPFIVLSVCYRLVAVKLKRRSFTSKQKSMRLVHAVVVAFILCWLPYHIVNIVDFVCILASGTKHDCLPQSVVFGSGALVFVSSSVNPVLYTFFAKSLKGSLKESGLVRLFRDTAAWAGRLREPVAPQQSGPRPADAQEALKVQVPGSEQLKSECDQ